MMDEHDESSPGKPVDQAEELARKLKAAKTQVERSQQAVAEDPRYGQLPEHYAEVCREWSLRDFWTPVEAANLLTGCDPKRPRQLPGHARVNASVERVLGVLQRADLARKGGWTKTLPARPTVEWARDKRMDVPAALLEAMGLAPTNSEESKPLSRESQFDRELCRAIARTLWDEYPDMNITHMAQHRAIKIYGNGAQYALDTRKDWVRDLDPRPEGSKGGRPRKQADKASDRPDSEDYDDS